MGELLLSNQVVLSNGKVSNYVCIVSTEVYDDQLKKSAYSTPLSTQTI